MRKDAQMSSTEQSEGKASQPSRLAGYIRPKGESRKMQIKGGLLRPR